jgi:hypothetical protein
VIGLQVTNEVNFYPIAPDASDSAFKRARAALIHGVEVAHRTVRRRGFDQLHVGFNWAYRTDPSREAGFWGYLRDHGGKRFARSVDWVGLDAYPGTIFPPTEPPTGTGYRDGMVNAMSVLRECYMPIARLGRDVPIHVGENGWPTGPGRSERQQARSMQQMVGAVNDFRGTYDVTDYRWFDLRDHNSSGPNFQQHYGLLRDDYSPKPAFGVYRGLVRRFDRQFRRGALAPRLAGAALSCDAHPALCTTSGPARRRMLSAQEPDGSPLARSGLPRHRRQ